MGWSHKRYAKVFPKNEALRKIITEYGEYFEVTTNPRPVAELKNELAVTLKDGDFVFTTEVRNIRIVQED
jgi:hypothetical protein|tara:strand:+ start:109 stop:318 length:210 start_codon:yes stop_codon:yes gene_type:complete